MAKTIPSDIPKKVKVREGTVLEAPKYRGEPHSEWLSRTQIIEKLRILEERMDIWKNMEDFYKVERIVIIEQRIQALETLHESMLIMNSEVIVDDLPSETLVPPLPELNVPEKYQPYKGVSLDRNHPPPDFVPPLPEPEPEQFESYTIIDEDDEKRIIQCNKPEPKCDDGSPLYPDIKDMYYSKELDKSLYEGNPKPAGEFTVGFGIDPGAPDFVPPKPAGWHAGFDPATHLTLDETEKLEDKIAALEAEIGEKNE